MTIRLRTWKINANFVGMETKDIRLLVVDDEESIREGLREYLDFEGYSVDSAVSAEDALSKGITDYDLLLLDVMMDGMSGFELAEKLKKSPDTERIPVIFLTAKDSDDDMVAGLRLGADDYIPKPFSMKNVIARIETVMRRIRRNDAPVARGVICDRETLSCRVDGNNVKLPRKEFEILALLLDNPGRIFTREELMRQIWPENVVVVDRSVDVHVTRIRSKIAPYGKNLVSRSGYGYGWQD